MEVIIRNMEAEDVSAITKIARESLGYDTNEELVRGQLEKVLGKEQGLLIVAEVNGQVAGFLHGEDWDFLYLPQEKYIRSLAVLKEYQNLHIGTRLLAYGEEWARSQGCDSVVLDSRMTRTDAHAFYRKKGYLQDIERYRFVRILS